MATLPSPLQVSGKNNAIFEAYYKQVDPKGSNYIEAMVAAKFLQKSGLSDVVLSRIWDLSDPKGQGFLDKAGLFVALKLVALAQAGHDINMRNIHMDVNPPKVGEIPKIIPQAIQNVSPSNSNWAMKPADREKYEQLFESLNPVNGLIPGVTVKGVLMDSKLPMDTLGKIWDLADQDKDGNLDKHEFIVAMHLVYQTLEKRAVPTSLPEELQKPKPSAAFNSDFVANFPKEMAPPPIPPLPMAMSQTAPRIPPNVPPPPAASSIALIDTDLMAPLSNNTQPALDWVVTPQEKIRYDGIFTASDLDKDGLVSGMEIKDIFLKSGVPQPCLAHIWGLCDTKQTGKLTSDEFALAMWMVERKKYGIEPPTVLAPNMIPPSLRNNSKDIITAAPIVEPQPTYSNPELEMISKEIEDLAKERRVLETVIAQKEADIRIKSGEVRSLQSELDTLAATLKQLENQKGEAQKRLDDLKAQVNKIREQCQKQEVTIKDQETELDSKRSELQKLKDEETALEKDYDNSFKELEKLTKKLQDTQLEISQVKAMVTQLQESQRQMNDALAMCKTAIEENDPMLVSEYSLKLEPDFREAKQTLEPKKEMSIDPFNENEGKNMENKSDPFQSNGFSSDPFNGSGTNDFNDKFTAGSGFDDAFGSSFQKTNAFESESDPFCDNKANSVTPDPSKDEFGSDPFAILHAPTSGGQVLSPSQGKSGPPPRPESPSPALPPKKAKQPPPRPAPPRPLQAPTNKMSSSGFGDNTSSGFADFADFDNKKIADFSEDPFKDYRYEDPFNIQDPFADEDIKVEDPFTSDKTSKFDDTHSFKNDLNRNNNKLPTIKLDLENYETKSNKKKLNENKTISKNENDNFANFDAFSLSTTTTMNVTKTTTSINNNNNNNNNIKNNLKSSNKNKEDFFDAFNDNFNKSTNINEGDQFLDAFGDIKNDFNKNIKSTVDFDAFNDEFSKVKIDSNIKNNNNNFGNDDNSFNITNFAKFDNESFSTTNTTTTLPVKSSHNKHLDKFEHSTNSLKFKNNKSIEKLKSNPVLEKKFENDYSKDDNFAEDLESVIKRSLVEQ